MVTKNLEPIEKEIIDEPSYRRVTIHRNEAASPIVYDAVETVLWTAGNTVLCIVCWNTDNAIEPSRIYWPRENIAWFRDEPS